MKRPAFIVCILICLCLSLASCTNNVVAVDSDCASVTFEGRNRLKGLVATIGSIDTDNYYWFYAAEKQDTGGTSGETSTYDYDGAVAVKQGEKGLNKEIGGFSVGDWKFKLFAYSTAVPTERSAFEYKGESATTRLRITEVAKINVNVTPRVEDGIGWIYFDGITAPGMQSGGTIKYKVDNGSYSEEVSYEVGSGNHSAYAAFFSSDEMIAENRIIISVVKNVRTTVSGTIDDLTTSIEFDVSDGRVVYNANGATGGSVPVDTNSYDAGDKVIVLGNTGSLVKTNCAWGGWNTKADGSGTTYYAGDTFLSSGRGVTLYALWLLPVGGRVFYVQGDSGLTYTFYDEYGNELDVVQENTTAQNAVRNTSLDNLWNSVKYYKAVGTKNAGSKFYVSNEEAKADSSVWGKDYDSGSKYYITNRDNDTVGKGQTNTSRILNKDGAKTVSGTIWYWLNNFNTASGGITNNTGCDDWFVPCTKELDELKSSGLVDWFDGKNIWSSTEYSGSSAWVFDDDNGWLWDGKRYPSSVFAIRSF